MQLKQRRYYYYRLESLLIFQRYDLKYLDDPKGSMGKAESINTIARKGLKEDEPEAYRILDNFKWSVKDMESIMLEIENGKDPEKLPKSGLTITETKLINGLKSKNDLEIVSTISFICCDLSSVEISIEV